MKVLVAGGTGMLGHKLAQVLGAARELELVVAVRRAPPAAFRAPAARYVEGVDLASGAAAVRRLLEGERPDVVVNAVGAIKQRDLAARVDESWYLNASLPHLLALLNPEPDARVVHFSTDCVFGGDRGGYTERDRPDAEDLYGRSKACGEIDYGRHTTLRTSIVGFEIAGNLGLLGWFLRQPAGSMLHGYTRAVFSGLPTVTLARTVRDLLVAGSLPPGLHHVASEPIDKHALLERVNRALGLGHRLVPDDTFVIDRSLDDRAFRERTGTPRPGWDELVEELARDFRSLPYSKHLAAGGEH
jgi:dTDP-4-dehydrorhamnose reductase